MNAKLRYNSRDGQGNALKHANAKGLLVLSKDGGYYISARTSDRPLYSLDGVSNVFDQNATGLSFEHLDTSNAEAARAKFLVRYRCHVVGTSGHGRPKGLAQETRAVDPREIAEAAFESISKSTSVRYEHRRLAEKDVFDAMREVSHTLDSFKADADFGKLLDFIRNTYFDKVL